MSASTVSRFLIGIAGFGASLLIFEVEAASGQDARLIAVVVADTESKNIAIDMESNIDAVCGALKKNVSGDSLTLRVLKGVKFTRHQVLRQIQDAQVTPADALMFFYCGHGQYDTTRGTFLVPPNDEGRRLYLSDIRDAMKQTRAHLRVCILDCCEVVPNGSMAAPAPSNNAEPPAMSPLFQSLFAKPSGEVVIRSCKPGERAVCHVHLQSNGTFRGYIHGSLFTGILSREWENRDRILTWEELHKIVKSQVAKDFNKFYPEGFIPLGNGESFEQATQTVWSFRDGNELD